MRKKLQRAQDSNKYCKQAHMPSPPKREKFEQILQDIKDDIQQVNICIETLQNYITSNQRDNYEANLEHIAQEVKKFRTNSQSFVQRLKGEQNYKPEIATNQVVETVFHVIQAQLFNLIPPMSFVYLASTSSRMFFYSMQVGELPFISSGKEFKHHKPTTFSSVDSDGVPQQALKIYFSYDFNGILPTLPSTITHITLGAKFNQSVDNLLPSSLTHLTFGKFFNSPVYHLPNNLTQLTFGKRFTESANHLPSSLTYLKFGSHFDNNLISPPPLLKVLKFGREYSHTIENLPHSLHTLSVFDLIITFLPPSLTKLKIKYPDSVLTCPLPPSLTYLSVAGGIESLDNLPPRLSHLKIYGSDLCAPKLNNLPLSISHLRISDYEDWDHENTTSTWHSKLSRFTSLPQNITHFTFETYSRNKIKLNLPPNITHLELGGDFDKPVPNLPPNIVNLTFGDEFNKNVSQLPPNITHLTFGVAFDKPVRNLPPTLTYLSFGEKFNQLVQHLPASLTHLYFGGYFNKSVNKLPPNLTHLSFGFYFNKPVRHLPRKITHLKFGFEFNQAIDNLPPTTTHLTLDARFGYSLNNLPPSVQHLTMCMFVGKSGDLDVIDFPTSLQKLKLIMMDGSPEQLEPFSNYKVLFTMTLNLWQHRLKCDYTNDNEDEDEDAESEEETDEEDDEEFYEEDYEEDNEEEEA